MNILELLKPGGKTALIQGGKSITYSELLDAGLKFGGVLRRKGIKKGGHVLVFMPLSIELYTAMIGAWSIGAAAIFIDFSRGSAFVDSSIERLKPDIIVCDGVTGIVRNIYPKMRRVKAINIARKGDFVEIEKVDKEHPAILTFTSGTTDLPKVAVRTHGFLINQYKALCGHIDFDENHVDLGTLAVFTLANLAANMTTLLPDKSYRSKINPAKLARQIQRHGVTRAICSPALMGKLLNHSPLSDVKSMYLGGGPVYPGLLKRISKDVDLHIVYGSTEAEPISGVRWFGISPEDKEKIARGEGLLVGHVVPEVECKIGGGKEILVSGETVLKGYLGGFGDKENKIHEGGKTWHRTGDAGYLDELGRLWLLGRVNEAIHDEKGELHPFCIECILDTNHGIRGAILTKDGERTVTIEKTSAKPADILNTLKPHRITQVIEIKKIPMDKRHGAKIDYEKLRTIL